MRVGDSTYDKIYKGHVDFLALEIFMLEFNTKPPSKSMARNAANGKKNS